MDHLNMYFISYSSTADSILFGDETYCTVNFSDLSLKYEIYFVNNLT